MYVTTKLISINLIILYIYNLLTVQPASSAENWSISSFEGPPQPAKSRHRPPSFWPPEAAKAAKAAKAARQQS